MNHHFYQGAIKNYLSTLDKWLHNKKKEIRNRSDFTSEQREVVLQEASAEYQAETQQAHYNLFILPAKTKNISPLSTNYPD